MRKLIYYVVVLVLLAGLVIGAWTPKPTLAQPPGEIRIGLNASLTGAGAPWGTAYTRTTETLVDKVNKEGGLVVGGKRYMLKYFKYDQKRDPSLAVENAKKLIFTDKVHTIFHHGAVTTVPALPLMSEHKILSMNISVGSAVLKFPYDFNILPAGTQWSLNAFKAFVGQWPGIKKIASLNPDSESGYANWIDDRRAIGELGLTLVAHEYWPFGTTDFYPILTKLIAAKPDAIIIGLGEPATVPVVVKHARELGWKGPLGMTQGSLGAPAVLVEMAGKGAEGFVYTTPFHSDPKFMTEEEKEMMDMFRKRYGEPYIVDYMGGLRQTHIWLEAVKKADSLDPDKIARVLETTQFEISGWKLHFISTPDTYMGRPRSLAFPHPVQTIKDGKAVLIDLILPKGVERVK